MARVSRLEWLLTYLQTSQRAPGPSRRPSAAWSRDLGVTEREVLPCKRAVTRDEWLVIFQEAEGAAFREAVSSEGVTARGQTRTAPGLESLRPEVEALALHVEQLASQDALTAEQAEELRQHVRALQRAVTPARGSWPSVDVAAVVDALGQKQAEAEEKERSEQSRIRLRSWDSGEDDGGGSHESH